MRTFILALLITLTSNWCAAAVPPAHTYTHNTPLTVSEPFSDSAASFKIARTWFLPDYQDGTSGRTENAPSGSGDRHDLSCSTYGGCSGVPANMTCSESFSAAGGTCYRSCSCKSGYVRINSSDVCQGCAPNCTGYTLGTPNCQRGQTTEYCRGDSRYFRCTGTACPQTTTCLSGSRCVKTAESVQAGCGTGCVTCEPCLPSVACQNGAKCASSTKVQGCPDICTKCCPAPLACENGCKTNSKEAGCTDVCIECKPKVCSKPDGVCWQLKTSTPSTTPSTPSTSTPTTTTPSTSTPTTTTPTLAGCYTTDIKVYRESKTETVTDDCSNTYTRMCYVPKPGYGWSEVTADKILYYSPDALTVMPIVPTGGIPTTSTTDGSYKLTKQYYKSCDRYYRRDCKLYESTDGFTVVGYLWNEGATTSTPSTSTPTTTVPTPTTTTTTTANSYGYPNPYTARTEERDSECGWKYTRNCYTPVGSEWTEIANVAGDPKTLIPSTIPDAPTGSDCVTAMTADYMQWKDYDMPALNCQGTLTFVKSCYGGYYYKCVVNSSYTDTKVDTSVIPTVITGKTLRALTLKEKDSATDVTQKLISCGKTYQRTCRVPSDMEKFSILPYGSVSTNMVSSCGINYVKKPTSTCALAKFPNCSGGTWFEIRKNDNSYCLTYQTCGTTTVTPGDTGGTTTTPTGPTASTGPSVTVPIVSSVSQCRNYGGTCRSTMCTPSENNIGTCMNNIVCCVFANR